MIGQALLYYIKRGSRWKL